MLSHATAVWPQPTFGSFPLLQLLLHVSALLRRHRAARWGGSGRRSFRSFRSCRTGRQHRKRTITQNGMSGAWQEWRIVLFPLLFDLESNFFHPRIFSANLWPKASSQLGHVFFVPSSPGPSGSAPSFAGLAEGLNGLLQTSLKAPKAPTAAFGPRDFGSQAISRFSLPQSKMSGITRGLITCRDLQSIGLKADKWI